jgi:hypothetical protein
MAAEWDRIADQQDHATDLRWEQQQSAEQQSAQQKQQQQQEQIRPRGDKKE